MLQLINDTPKEIIDMLKAVNYKKFTKAETEKMLNELEGLIEKFRRYIPIRPPANYKYVKFYIPDCPDRLIRIANRNWWAKIGRLHRAIAMPLIKRWFKDNLT